MACDVFIHISTPPSNPIMDSELPIKTHIEEKVLVTSGGSSLEMLAGKSPVTPLSFDAEMIDFTCCTLVQLNSHITYNSHGMNREDFIKQHRAAGLGEEVAIFIYKKTK